MSFYPNAIISCFPYPFLIFPDKSEFFLFFPSGILHNIYPGNFINSYYKVKMPLLVISFLDLELPVFDVLGRFVLGHRPAVHRYIQRYCLNQKEGEWEISSNLSASMLAAAPGRQRFPWIPTRDLGEKNEKGERKGGKLHLKRGKRPIKCIFLG